ncbi:restriction endonuclease subunit S [Acetivibrio clariflavus]|uniref:Restriction endonuclease S subunit n=1 Tax=Acetivibrio clariflavus (strain DSM 19732 / NBRC 101661 / EBR45) TaxID=720554 RepID=G8LSK6_ACECE|nr:restriction endonuclease subunit S [Acetivibrio clariflavus]AEV68310.1 restriction endonuclease S subunit [Acetivibrio clariflavus DSM 19732]
MTEWRECKLGDVIVLNYGKALPEKKRVFGNIPVYSSAGLTGYHNESLVNGRGIIIGRKGTIGSVHFSYKPFWCIDTAYYITDNEEYNLKYIYYLLQTLGLNELNEDSAVPGLNRNTAYQQDISFPPLPEQKAIAEVLSSLDDKIDLLTRQNKTLEDLAQAYFRKWFIEDASSEWEVGKLGDEFNITMGQSPKGETYNDLKIGLPFFQGKAEFGFRFPLEKQYCSEPIKIADKFDTLLSVRAPVGALNMALYKCCIGRGLAIPIHKKGYKHYTFYKMKSLQELFNTFDDDGTVFGSISREKFLSIDNVIPPEKLVCYFDNFAKYFDLKIYENTVQIRTLSKLRDTLLPKLISGEVRVNI